MEAKDLKEILADKKTSEVSESIAKEKKVKVTEIQEKFSRMNLLHSGPHAKARIDIERDALKKLLISKLEIDIDVFFKIKPPSSNDDEIFLINRIEKLYKGAMRGAKQSLEDFKARYMYPDNLDDFLRKAKEILAEVKRKIEIIVLENKISFPVLADISIDSLIKTGECDQIEFKSTFQWDVKKECKNENLRMEVVSTITAFNNTVGGGYLLIGVDDDGNIYGLERDYSLLKKKRNRDGFMLLLTQEIENRISREFITRVNIKIENRESKDVCKIKVNFGDDCVWVKDDQNNDIFFIRTINSTRKLTPRKAAEYIRKTWPYVR